MLLASIRTAARFLEVRNSFIFSALGAVSAAGLIAMIMITVADATGRRFFSSPIYGSYESVTLLLSIVFFSSLSYCTIKRGHFAIDVVTSHFSPRVRLYISSLMYLISGLLSWMLAWQLVVLSLKLKASHLTGTQFTFLPVYPFGLFGALCLAIAGWAFLVQFLNFLVKTIEEEIASS
jgi:TRAP-type C4-dicarboxylate transport system permease small subunit